MSQANLLFNLLLDRNWHRTDEILEKVYGFDHVGIARVGARIADLKRKGCVIYGKPDKMKHSLYWYRLIKAPGDNVAPPKENDMYLDEESVRQHQYAKK